MFYENLFYLILEIYHSDICYPPPESYSIIPQVLADWNFSAINSLNGQLGSFEDLCFFTNFARVGKKVVRKHWNCWKSHMVMILQAEAKWVVRAVSKTVYSHRVTIRQRGRPALRPHNPRIKIQILSEIKNHCRKHSLLLIQFFRNCHTTQNPRFVFYVDSCRKTYMQIITFLFRKRFCSLRKLQKRGCILHRKNLI